MVARGAEGGVGAAAAAAKDGVAVAAVAEGGTAAAAAAAEPRADGRVVVALGVVEVFVVVRFVARGVLEEDDVVDGERRLRCLFLFASVLICVMMLLTASSTPGACGHTG